MTLFVTFHSVSAALYAKKLLEKRGMPCAVVPVPRSVSSSCGYTVEIAGVAADALTDALSDAVVDWVAVYQAFGEGGSTRFELVAACPDGE